MSRLRATFKIVIPSMLAGGLLFGLQFGHAAGGGDEVFGFWPATADVGSTQAVPKPPKPPRRGPMPSTPPTPPTPPTPHVHGTGGGISISVNGNKVQIHGIDAMVQGQLEAVRQMIRNNPNIPKDLRDKIFSRMDKVKGIVDKRVKNLKVDDLDRLEEELEEMGQELEQAMEGLEEDLEKLGVKLGKDFADKFGKAGKLKLDLKNKHLPDPDVDVDVDDVDDSDVDTIPMTPDVDDEDMRDAIGDLKDLALSPNQKDRIAKLAADSDRNVADAKRQLDAKSDQLEAALADSRTSDAAIARMVDEISAHEAAIRKARLLAWVNARRVLDDSQRKKIEAAAQKRTR